MHRIYRALRFVLVLSLVPQSLAGQTDDGSEPTPAARGVATASVRTTPIRVDGRLDEAAWATARPITDFVQAEPVEGAAVEHRTEVRVLFDDEAVYVAARMFDSAPGSIGRQMVRRDEWGAFDFFEFSVDPVRDRRTGYRFQVSAAGVQRDDYLFDDVKEDRSWDAVWESAVQRDDEGWTAEMRIPLSQIRFRPSDAPQTWGVNFGRRRLASNERSFYALESRRQHGRVSVFRPLAGLMLDRGAKRLEARPYVLASGHTGPAEPGDPFFDGRAAAADAGVDLRYGLGSAFTLDATVNPDFGQVEVDPAVINLSAFETFFPERRPFFVEDARIFDFNLSGRQNSLFYSRRIGREPHRDDLAGATFTDAPEQTSILGSAKLTGRTSGGLSVGALAAVTRSERASAYFAAGDSVADFLAEPRTEAGVVRMQQDLFGGRSVVGGIVTAMRRELPGDGTFDFLPSDAYSAGLDFEHTWSDREWALTGFVAGTHVRGTPKAMLELQTSSSHYFQRPDADYLSVDSTATSMTGMEWRLQAERRSGENWTGGVWMAERTPGFEVNDLGYFQGSGRLDGGARVSYQEITPGPIFRDYRINAFTFHNFRHDLLDDPFSAEAWGRTHKAGTFALGFAGTFPNYWQIDTNLRLDPENLDDGMTRGGPLMIDPRTYSFSVRGNTDRRARFGVEPSFRIDNDGAMGWGWEVGLETGFRPSSRVEIEVEPSYSSQPDAAQYVAATGDVGFAPTYGRRYLFGDLERRTFSLDTRLNVTFTPRLTLQLFTQPLLSVGDYTAYKQLAAAETFDFDRFEEGTPADPAGSGCVGGRTCRVGDTRYVDFDGDGATDFRFTERDFRIRSLRGNAVLRWEYRPGSTVFLVWQQRRSFRDRQAGTFDLGGEAIDLFQQHPDNMFIIKMNYWLSM